MSGVFLVSVTLASSILKIAAKMNMGTETGGRFVNISDEEVTQFCEEQENDNTKKKTLNIRYSIV